MNSLRTYLMLIYALMMTINFCLCQKKDSVPTVKIAGGISCHKPKYKHYFNTGFYKTKETEILESFIAQIEKHFEKGRSEIVFTIFASASNDEKDTCCGKGNIGISYQRAQSLIEFVFSDVRIKKYRNQIILKPINYVVSGPPYSEKTEKKIYRPYQYVIIDTQ